MFKVNENNNSKSSSFSLYFSAIIWYPTNFLAYVHVVMNSSCSSNIILIQYVWIQTISKSSDMFNLPNDQKSLDDPFFLLHCKKNGHTQDKCYMLHGFPIGFKFTNGSKNNRLIPFSLINNLWCRIMLLLLHLITNHCSTLKKIGFRKWCYYFHMRANQVISIV